MRDERPFRHAEELALGGVGIGHEAAVEDVGGARHLGDRAGKEPAGAAFRNGENDARLPRARH